MLHVGIIFFIHEMIIWKLCRVISVTSIGCCSRIVCERLDNKELFSGSSEYEGNYCKQTFIRMREMFAKFAWVLTSRIFLAANQSLSYCCFSETGLNKAWS